MDNIIFKQSELIKKHYGKCALCGRECKLTFEHIPPEAALNSTPAKPITLDTYLTKNNLPPWERIGPPYINQQRGSGLYSLCEICNSFTGANYENSYCDFAKKAYMLVHSNIDSKYHSVAFSDIYPLQIIKQVCSMFCSINSIYRMQKIREFVLNKEAKGINKDEYKIQMYFTSSNIKKFIGFFVINDMLISEIVVPPLGFILIWDPNPEKKYVGFDITSFSEFNYDEKATIQMPLDFREVNTIWPYDYITKEEYSNS